MSSGISRTFCSRSESFTQTASGSSAQRPSDADEYALGVPPSSTVAVTTNFDESPSRSVNPFSATCSFSMCRPAASGASTSPRKGLRPSDIVPAVGQASQRIFRHAAAPPSRRTFHVSAMVFAESIV